jgi:hypothetical protein
MSEGKEVGAFGADWTTRKVIQLTILRPLPVDNLSIYLGDFVAASR